MAKKGAAKTTTATGGNLGSFQARIKSPCVVRGDTEKERFLDVKIAVPKVNQEEVVRWIEDHLGGYIRVLGVESIGKPESDPNQEKMEFGGSEAPPAE